MLQIPIELLKPHVLRYNIGSLAECLNKLEHTTVASTRGLQTEKDIAARIEGFTVDTEKRPHAGDFVIWKRPDYRIMIEVKNYTSTVPRSQWEKFVSDRQISGYEAAIMITNQPVVGIENRVWFSGPVACVVSYDTDIINLVCQAMAERVEAKVVTEHDLQNKFDSLQHSLDILFELKCCADRMSKCLTKEMLSIYKKIDRLILNTKTLISSVAQLASEVKFDTGFGSRVEVAEKLQTLLRDEDRIEIRGNVVTVTRVEQVLIFTNLKTKLKISFTPRTRDFTNYDVNFIGGRVEIDITEKNYSTDIWDVIAKLV